MNTADRAWEAMATHAELRARFEERWPAFRRRFRVEGSAAGTGFLTSRARAQTDATRYGGKVVEVIRLVPLGVRQAKGMPPCPHCKVGMSEPCRTRDAAITVPHARRWDAHNDE